MTERVASEGRPHRWLNISVIGFGLASFLSDAGHEAATSALPALLATIGAAPAALGVIEGIADGLSSFAKLAGGFWADRPERRKPTAIAGYLVTGLASGAFAVATSWIHVLAARSLAWFARGLRGPSREAMLADSVPKEALGRAFGFHRAFDTAGAVLGPLFATLLLSFVPLRWVFWWSLVPGVLSAVAFAVLVRRQAAHPDERHIEFWKNVRALPPPFRRFLGAVFLFGIGDFARTLLILRATQLLSPHAGAVAASTTAMLLYAGHNVVYAGASYPAGWLADKVPSRPLLAFGYGLGTITAILAALATPSLAVLVPLFIVAGLTLAIEDTLEGTMTAQLVDSSIRGTAYGVLATTNGVGDLVSSSMVGILWASVGATPAFLAAAALCFLGTLVLALAAGHRERRE